MVPISGDWTPFADRNDQIIHYRRWGLISEKASTLRPIMVVDGYLGVPQPCNVVGYQGDNWAVIQLADGFHAIHGNYLAEMQPTASQPLPRGVCFADILARYIVLDIETTGFEFRRDRITEIAAYTYEYGEKTAEFHTYINPERLIPENVTTLTGITQEMANSAPFLEDVESDFFEFIGDAPIIGHNVRRFDIPFLNAWLSTPVKNLLVDTLPMAQKVFDLLPCHKLDYLKGVLRLGNTESHRAFTDVETTNALLWACLAPRRYEKYVNAAFLDHRMSQSGEGGKSATQK